jgi:hypothetical protein
MAEISNLHYVYAIQYLRSHLQELVEAENLSQVDQELSKLLKQPSSEETAEQFRELIVEHDKAYDWWLDFVQTIQPVGATRGFTGSGAADARLYGDSSPDPLLISCVKCGFSNRLLSWSDNLPCQNPDGTSHAIEL